MCQKVRTSIIGAANFRSHALACLKRNRVQKNERRSKQTTRQNNSNQQCVKKDRHTTSITMAVITRNACFLAMCICFMAITGTLADRSVMGRRSLLQSADQFGSNRPSWFNNNRLQAAGFNSPSQAGFNNWGSNPAFGARPQVPNQAFGQAGAQAAAKNKKGDYSSLSSLTSPVQGLQNRPRQTIAPPTTGPASTLYQGLRRGGNAKAAAQSLAETYNSNSEAAATAVASAATEGGSSTAVAEAVAQTSVTHPAIAPGLLAKSADLAVNKGQTAPFANTMAGAFSAAKRGGIVPQFTRSVTDAVAQGGAPARLAFGEAIATAVAQGGDSQAAVAEATATAFCEGGSTAQSWASAYAVALSKDSKGCLVLNEAKAMAQAKCGAGAAEAISKAEATSMVLGFCGLLDLVPDINYNYAGGNSGSSSWSP